MRIKRLTGWLVSDGNNCTDMLKEYQLLTKKQHCVCKLACDVILGETVPQVALQHSQEKEYKFNPFTMQWSVINHSLLYSNFQKGSSLRAAKVG